MKTRILYILFVFLVCGSTTSCSVEVAPETSMSDANFWNSEGDLRLAANFFYTTLPGLTSKEVTQDNWSNDAYPNSSGNEISDGSRPVPAENEDYIESYKNIFQANKLIEKAPLVLEKGGDEIVVNQYIGEARFFRAFYYFEMLKRYGGVPLITHTLTVDDPDVFAPRASRDEVLELIYGDLDYAIGVLPSADELNSASEYGRISKTGALAFKSRVALFEGTRAKFHEYGDFSKHLSLAKEAAEAVMSSGEHELFTQPSTGSNDEVLNNAYFNLFQEEGNGRGNRENIIVRRYGESFENNIVSTPVQRYYEGNSIVPTQNFVDNYLMGDGLPKDKSPLYKEPDQSMTHAEYFDGKDPRMAFTLFKRGDEFISGGNYTVPSPSKQRSGYGIRKYANKEFWARQVSFIDKPVLRYAEVLLNYAEAVYELDDAISDDVLNKTINVIRARLPEINIGTAANPVFVSLPRLTNAFVGESGLNMRDEIRRERKVELAFEGFSYWDLLRWKTAEKELPKTLYGSYLFAEYLTNSGEKWDIGSTTVDENNYIILQRSSLRRFDPKKDYLWPLPTTELAKNDALEQNPGWK